MLPETRYAVIGIKIANLKVNDIVSDLGKFCSHWFMKLDLRITID